MKLLMQIVVILGSILTTLMYAFKSGKDSEEFERAKEDLNNVRAATKITNRVTSLSNADLDDQLRKYKRRKDDK